VPIPGTKRREYLEENTAAVDAELTDEDLRRIEQAVPTGARLPATATTSSRCALSTADEEPRSPFRRGCP
jgi:diketogulonate reductase-like aldo/keto reductase